MLICSCTKEPEKTTKDSTLPSTNSSRIHFAQVSRRKIAPTVECTGQIKPDFGKECLVSARLAGRILKLLNEPGDHVSKGQILGYVDSQQVGELQAQAIRAAAALDIARAYEEREKAVYEEELIRPKSLFKARTARQRAKVSYDAAVRDFDRMRTLVREKIAAEKDFLKARSTMETAELELNLAKLEEKREERLFANKGLIKKDWQVAHAETKRCVNELATLKEKLKFLGVDTDVVGNSIASRQLDARLPIVSPASGTVVQQLVSPGEIVSPDETIFSICQMNQVAVDCQLPEADLSLVREGAPIEAKIATYGDRVFRGTIVYVGSRLDSKTRSVQARAILDNTDGLLKLNMFAKVIIHGKDRIALVCPKDALHQSGGKNVVYTRDHGKFIAKEITPGITCDDQVEVIKGLKPGENVITDGGVLVKMELMMEHKAL